jgi:uncharacterized protein
MVRILSIDGGGIRGIIPGQVLVALEEKLKKHSKDPEARIGDYFDFIAGTSTGGILSCLYLCPGANGKPQFSAADAVHLYTQYGKDIFQLSFWEKIKSVGGLLEEKYASSKLEKYLLQYFGEIKLDQLLKPCLITSFKINENGQPFFFTTHDAIKKGAPYNFYVRDVCRATSAAPTYFETAYIKAMDGKAYPLIDGGVFANNPSMCAYAEVRASLGGARAADMYIVSLSTGTTGVDISYAKAKKWGAVGWVKPLIDVMMTGVSQTTDYELKQMFHAVGKPENYHRIEPPKLTPEEAGMDNVSEKNIQNLIKIGESTALKFDAQLEEIARVVCAQQKENNLAAGADILSVSTR